MGILFLEYAYTEYNILSKRLYETFIKGVSMIRVDFGPISETDYIDIILNTIIER
jgi:hypothetical protein